MKTHFCQLWQRQMTLRFCCHLQRAPSWETATPQTSRASEIGHLLEWLSLGPLASWHHSGSERSVSPLQMYRFQGVEGQQGIVAYLWAQVISQFSGPPVVAHITDGSGAWRRYQPSCVSDMCYVSPSEALGSWTSGDYACHPCSRSNSLDKGFSSPIASGSIQRHTLGFPGGSDGKESACNAGDLGLIPGLRRSPGGRHGNPLQYSCLENPMDRAAW